MHKIPFSTVILRFWKKVSAGKPNECWIWKGTHSGKKAPYGMIAVAKRGKRYTFEMAHRIAWRIYNGRIPKGKKVLHTCDVTLCVNPNHLFLGTQLDNMRDCAAKGRNYVLHGTLHPKHKLNNLKVRFIRRSTLPGIALAKRFGVRNSLISAVRKFKVWKHVK